ncbi:acyltransferase family protein [Yeosuana sp.]|uniref:acyltransferase family protein n=1 Tax=Yeosuana sp. TaxID=2529388 RepID=UPI00405515EA
MNEPFKTQRLYSLDALRGFDMFWIIGAEEIFHKLSEITGAPFWQALSVQFTHPAWNGFAAYDMIFPLFLFLAGIATPYSIGRQLENGSSKKSLLVRVIKRGLILVVLGIIYSNGLQILPLNEIRFPSVLGRIGLAYMFANIIYLYTSKRGQIIWFGTFLIGYWLLLLFNSAPGYAMGDLTMEGNFVSYIDRLIIPGKLYLGIHDPEGLIATIPAISTALLGILVGTLLKQTTAEKKKTTAIQLVIIGVVLIIVAQIWNLVFPFNKNLWTSSFALQCGGISTLLMAGFYYIIDILEYKKWAFFFKVIGMNSILIYMSGQFIDWTYTTNAIFEWLGQLVGEPYNALVLVFCFLTVEWVFLYVLYRNKIFLKV